MKAIDRLYQYIEYKGFKPTNFEREIGLSSGYLSKQKGRSADIGETIVVKINENCPELNLLWLLTGEGEMLKKNIEGDDASFKVETKKTEPQDKKKCRNVQNIFNEKNAHPLNKSNTKEDAHPLFENAHPFCTPNSENEPQKPFFSMASEEREFYQETDTPVGYKREKTEGVSTDQIIGLKDNIIDTQKSYISSLEVQLKDFRRDNEILRRDVFELKKDLRDIKKELENSSKLRSKQQGEYASAWAVDADHPKR